VALRLQIVQSTGIESTLFSDSFLPSSLPTSTLITTLIEYIHVVNVSTSESDDYVQLLLKKRLGWQSMAERRKLPYNRRGGVGFSAVRQGAVPKCR